MQKMKVLYHNSVLDVFENEVTKIGIRETGGVLLGWTENENIIVAKATGAGPNAVHEKIFFRADANYIDMIIDMEYANSNGKINYIGEWHTHPQMNPRPSQVDLNSLDEIVESSGEPNLLLIIGAIDFKKDFFVEQSISILKFPSDDRYFELEAHSWQIE
jgi:integrative and conjugative element protein (TIGR02256 family)